MKAGFAILLIGVLACNNEKISEAPQDANENTAFDLKDFSGMFPTATAPYQLTDSAIQNNKDTTLIRNQDFLNMIPDSVEEKVFGKNARIKYTPLAKVELPGATTEYFVKGVSGSKKSVLLLTFKKNETFGAAFPFITVDTDKNTSQVSTLEKNGTITRSLVRRSADDAPKEGKDVYVYNQETNQFDLIMTDILDDSKLELINPIDTLARTHKWSGDYAQNKNNLVSIRDGRKRGFLTVFIHIEKKGGDCTGEIKGDAQIIAPDKAVYRQAGDPCVLELNFKSSSVTLKEVEGCGSRRDLECSFDGTYPRKKAEKEKNTSKSKKRNS